MANSVRGRLKPGEDYWVRYYLIVGALGRVVDNARKYAKKADYGVLGFTEERATLQPLYLEKMGEGAVTLTRRGAAGAGPACRVYNEPALNSMPLFSVRELPSGRGIVTTDPYGLSRKEKYANPLPKDHGLHGKLANVCGRYPYQSREGKGLKWDLLGYVMPADKAKGNPEGYVEIESLAAGPGSGGWWL